MEADVENVAEPLLPEKLLLLRIEQDLLLFGIRHVLSAVYVDNFLLISFISGEMEDFIAVVIMQRPLSRGVVPAMKLFLPMSALKLKEEHGT